MALMPVLAAGRVRLQPMEVDDSNRESWLKDQENERRLQVARRRVYYDGVQYEQANKETASALGVDWLTGRLPEHRRLHAYSTQIQECIDFLADQMASEFAVEADDAQVQEIIDTAFRLSVELSGTEDEDDVDFTNVLRDALIAGDVVVQGLWSQVEGAPYPMFWESEEIRLDYDQHDSTKIVKAYRESIEWLGVGTEEAQHVRRDVWQMLGQECVHEVWYDEDTEPTVVEPIGLPFVPFVPMRASKKGLSATRGESAITQQGMESADRYNAVEQVSWLIARYNSHGNLAVIGDAATLKAQQEERIEKDVADVLTFPGGTALSTITLPTDPEMIVHQREVLLDSLYGSFGLTRVDQSTVSGLGAVSGYALEILNRKTDGTFRRIRKQFSKDVKTMLNMLIDMKVYLENSPIAAADQAQPDETLLPDVQVESLLAADPMAAFPNRKMEIRMGGVYIVDDVLVRNDFTAKLISQAEALRLRGYDDKEIEKIQAEQKDEAPPAPEAQMFTTATGDVVSVDAKGVATLTGSAPGASQDTAAGSTVDQTGTRPAGAPGQPTTGG